MASVAATSSPSLYHSKWDCKYTLCSCPNGAGRPASAKRRRQLVRFSTRWLGKRSADRRRPPDAGPCAYVRRDCPQASRHSVSEGEECHRHRPVWAVKKETSQASISGLAVTRCPPSGSNWSRSAHTRLRPCRIREQDAADGAGDNSEPSNKARIARRLDQPPLRRPNSSKPAASRGADQGRFSLPSKGRVFIK